MGKDNGRILVGYICVGKEGRCIVVQRMTGGGVMMCPIEDREETVKMVNVNVGRLSWNQGVSRIRRRSGFLSTLDST